MLALRRKVGETIRIGPGVEVKVLEVDRSGRVLLGISAHKSVTVERGELPPGERAGTRRPRRCY